MPTAFELIGNALVLIGVLVAYIAYRRDYKKDSVERLAMHIENQLRLKMLGEFHETQLAVNTKRDEQIYELKTQTALLVEIARGMDRRLTRIEGK